MKNIFLTLFILAMTKFLVISQNNRIEEVNVYTNIDEFKNKGKLDLLLNQKKSNFISFSDANIKSKSEEQNKIIQSFSVLKLSPNNNYYIAYYEGDNDSRYCGFFDNEYNLYSYFEINMEPQVNFSTNGEYCVVFSRYRNDFYLFKEDGSLVKKGNYKEITQSQDILYNIFIDSSGNKLIINTNFHLICYDILQNVALWNVHTETRRSKECFFDNTKSLLIAKNLTPKSKKGSNEEPYTLEVFDLKSGLITDQIQGISELFIINNNIVLKSNKNWHEYKIK